jgi:hypothetical protein
MAKHLQSEGEWLPEDKELAQQVAAWAPQFSMHKGILCLIKWRKGRVTRTREEQGNQGLEPLMQMYIPSNSTMKQDIVLAVHKELGHTGIMRTYQAIQDRFFWKGMFADVYKEVLHCTTCQYHAPKAARAAIAGHIVAARPAEMLTMDIVHMPNVNDYKYMLTVVDVFTKYGAAVPLTEITATAVITALAQEVLVHGYGRPKYWIVDGGSEFQDVMEQTVKAWGATLHRSSANHPLSHGLMEEYNQT